MKKKRILSLLLAIVIVTQPVFIFSQEIDRIIPETVNTRLIGPSIRGVYFNAYSTYAKTFDYSKIHANRFSKEEMLNYSKEKGRLLAIDNGAFISKSRLLNHEGYLDSPYSKNSYWRVKDNIIDGGINVINNDLLKGIMLISTDNSRPDELQMMYLMPDAYYTVKHRDIDTGEILESNDKVSIWRGTVIEEPNNISGYIPVRNESSRFYLNKVYDNIFYIDYKKENSKEIEYKVRHVEINENGEEVKIIKEYNNTGLNGQRIVLKSNEFEGYKLDGEEEKNIILEKNRENIFTFKYRKDLIEYKVRHIEIDSNGNEVDIIEKYSLEGINGTKIRLESNKYNGYKLVGSNIQNVAISPKNNIFTFKYIKTQDVKDKVNYTVKHIEIDENGKEVYLIEKVFGKASDGDIVEINSNNYKKYKLIGDKKQKFKAQKDKENIIIFKYIKIDSNDPNIKPEIPNIPEIKPEKPLDPIKPEIKPELNREEHFAYLQGYTDNTIRGEGEISREEVAAVFFRLLDKDYRNNIRSSNNDFKDIETNRWSNKHISTLLNGDILIGYKDGNFKPEKPITRAEVATIIARFCELEEGHHDFIDIEDHWAEESISSILNKGWIKGYEDGSFKPEKNMTRGEFASFMNNILNRKILKENIIDGIINFKDLDSTQWYYEDLIEATNSHISEDERLNDGSEIWEEILDIIVEM